MPRDFQRFRKGRHRCYPQSDWLAWQQRHGVVYETYHFDDEIRSDSQGCLFVRQGVSPAVLYISVSQVARGVGDIAMFLMPMGERRNQCL